MVNCVLRSKFRLPLLNGGGGGGGGEGGLLIKRKIQNYVGKLNQAKLITSFSGPPTSNFAQAGFFFLFLTCKLIKLSSLASVQTHYLE